ncbi:MAG: hypothetical protein JWP40_3931 [Blastococcus sp.]|nr:hypothetical protein [Blastococcus sp.]
MLIEQENRAEAASSRNSAAAPPAIAQSGASRAGGTTRLSRITSGGGANVSTRRPWARRLAENRFLVLLLVGFALSSVIWDLLNRRGQPYDIDESGYLGFSLMDFQSLGRGGLLAWAEQVVAPSIFSPLTTALTTPVYLVLGPRPLAALMVPLLFSLIAIAATYGLARRVAGESVARGAAVLTASVPVIIQYSRDYHFAAAATAVTAAALYFLTRSDGMSSRRWSVAFGVAIGLLPLARTMTVAFIPGFAAAVIVILIANGERLRRLANAVLAGVTAICVAALWLGPNGNGQAVWNYLTGFGYGSASTQYGTDQPLFSFGAWLTTLQVMGNYVLLPHLLLFMAGAIASVAVVLRLLFSSGGIRRFVSAGNIRRIALSPLLPMASVVGLGLVALTSSANHGSAFGAPLVPAMCILSVWALRSVFHRLRWTVSIAIGIAAVIATVPLLPIPWALTGTWTVALPEVGTVAVASGQGVISQYLQQGRAGSAALTVRDPGLVAVGREWAAENRLTADHLQGRYGDRALVAMGFRHRHLNPNSVNLAQMAAGNRPLPLVMVQRESTEDTIDAYRTWLRDGTAATSCLLLTASGSKNEFEPLTTEATMTAAAKAEGFQAVNSWPLPDGRTVTEWQRSHICPA